MQICRLVTEGPWLSECPLMIYGVYVLYIPVIELYISSVSHFLRHEAANLPLVSNVHGFVTFYIFDFRETVAPV